MIRKIGILVITMMVLSSCVSKKIYQELETKYNKLRTSNAELLKEKDELLVAKKALENELKAVQDELAQLKTDQKVLKTEYEALQNKHKKLEELHEALSTQSSQQLADQAKRNQDLLTQLEEKEKLLAFESDRLLKLQNELNDRAAEVDELKNMIAAKEAQMQQLKTAISNALHKFEGNGLTVEHKNGKIYVSMENKLLFSSGSWAVGVDGKQAVEQLAEVLSNNPDINVLIEGHTDNVPYTGTTLIDNWDLSVKRATAIVRILKNNGVDPTQITAAGRSEYIPVDTNATADGKAKNRRIEIILAPNLDEISKLLNE